MHPRIRPQKNRPNIPTPAAWALLLAAGLALNSPAQELPSGSWSCGPYSSQDQNAPAGSGSTISYSSSQTSASGGGVATDNESAYLVFSTKGYTFDANGNVSGYETIVRPSAGAQAAVSWAGPDTPGSSLREGGGPSAQAAFYARVSPKAGAPAGGSVPLSIHVMGFAQCETSDPVTGWNSYALASSSVACSGGSIAGSASASYDLPHAEYDQAGTLVAQVGETITGGVWVQAVALCSFGDPASSHGYAQAFADPSIDIDPSFTNKDQFYLEYSPDPLFSPPNPLVLSLLSGIGASPVVQLSGPTNVVYELQSATSFPATQWQATGTVTNTAGTVSFTNSPGSQPQGFYRARALRKAQ